MWAQSNRYQLQQMSYMQFETKPRHVPECLRDLTAMYDAIAVPDLYQVRCRMSFHLFRLLIACRQCRMPVRITCVLGWHRPEAGLCTALLLAAA